MREAFWKTERAEKMGIGCDEHYPAYTGTYHESPLYKVNLEKAKEYDALF